MKTLYAACLSRLGLSQPEASAFHRIGLQVIKNWCVGRTPVPAGIWAELRAYEARIIDRSEAVREAWEDSGEARSIEAETHGDPVHMMALADFLLSTDEEPPVVITVLS